MLNPHVKFASFWQRLLAFFIDSLIFSIVLGIFGSIFFTATVDQQALQRAFDSRDLLITWTFLLSKISVEQVLFNHLLIFGITVFCWLRFMGTPGKQLLSIKVVDATTGKPLSISRSILRYLAYLINFMCFSIGFLWILFDGRNQAWHDKLGNSVVVIGQQPTTVQGSKPAQSSTTDDILKA